MGLPGMAAYWVAMKAKEADGTITKEEQDEFNKLKKAVGLLSADPRHPGLHSHEIEALSKRFKDKVFESYLENDTSSAARVFLAYGPVAGAITVIGMEPHPEKGNKAYKRIPLSMFPAVTPRPKGNKNENSKGTKKTPKRKRNYE